MLIVAILVFVISTFLSYGLFHAHIKGEFPCQLKKNKGYILMFSVVCGVLGPIGLFIAFCCTNCAEHGISWKD